ncbi:Pyruvate dehydrogenase E1 component subunit beta-1, mitochondrial [Sesamum angolense]|uniref:Pyruvate dehydrogenase E1 component subunit beta n=1 Tax=Sesamum angolense TaxID=2727404 RepID=A0AAE1W900_9LAMI|nr:Pyruvate dehydrogenase E1 component subunit beta-1, mitochondrial [Sesamum angolense]
MVSVRKSGLPSGHMLFVNFHQKDQIQYVHKIERIAGADVPMPYAANLEQMALPQVEDIVRAAKRVCYRSVPMSASAKVFRPLGRKLC